MTSTSRRFADVALTVVFVLCSTFYFWTSGTGAPCAPQPIDEPVGPQYGYYALLTDGFLHGSASLLIKPSPELLALADPHDPSQNFPYRLHDALLYGDKYYLYWGVAPVLLLYAPVRMLSGCVLRDDFACALFASGGLLFYLLLLRRIRLDHYGRSSVITLVLLAFALAFGSQTPFVLRRSAIYEAVIFCGYFLSGAFLFLSYLAAYRGWIDRRRLTWAGICLGFLFLSRPTLAANAIVLAAGLLLTRAFRRPDRSNVILAAQAFVPLALAALGQGVYNFARFGSPLDYGVKYQLAGVNLEHYRLFSVARGLYDSVLYFFSVPAFGPEFPFVHAVRAGDGLTGPFAAAAAAIQPLVPYTDAEVLAGVAIVAPCLVLLFCAPLYLSAAPPEMRLFVATLLTADAAIAFVTACYAGPTLRYVVDFSPSLLLVAAIFALWAESRFASRSMAAVFQSALAVSVVFTVAVSSALSMTGYYDTFRSRFPQSYAAAKDLFRPLERLLVGPDRFPGALRARISLPACRPHELGQPLLVSGTEGAADFFFLSCDPLSRRFVVGWDHWNRPTRYGQPFDAADPSNVTVAISTPSLFPPPSFRANDTIAVPPNCIVSIDGREVFNVTGCDTYPNDWWQIYAFRNPLGGTTTASAYGAGVRLDDGTRLEAPGTPSRETR